MSEDDRSGRLGLPYLLPAQAQKHVTHNEALQLLDALVQLVITGFGAEIPPTDPAPGEVHALGPAPTGAWEGQAGMLACRGNGDWLFVAPAEGWLAHDLAGGGLRVFRDGDWWPFWQDVPQLGVNAAADAVNRLAVAGPATLLTHTGAGHQLKLNKAAAADTASLLFQTGWAGRAEMGLVASDDFVIKVSADGTAFHTALSIARANGHVTVPAGLGLADGTAALPGMRFAADEDTGIRRTGNNALALVTGGTDRLRLSGSGAELAGKLTGTAVVQSDTDTTAGRIPTVGYMGLGATSAPEAPDGDLDTLLVGGIYRISNSTANTPAGAGPTGSTVHVMPFNSTNVAQLFANRSAPAALWLRYKIAGGWGAWQRLYSTADLLGTVSQSGGVPTGAVIEAGSNANGKYTRFADGTQICTHTLAAAAGGGKPWTFPAAFATAPVITGNAQAMVLSAVCLDSAPTTTGVSFSARDKTDARRADTCHMQAIGRWF